MIGYLRIAIFLLLTFILSFKSGAQNQTVTNGTATIPVNFTGTGCRYNWTNNNPAIGLPASGIGNIASFTAVNTGTAPITATITATPVPAGYAYIPNATDNVVSAVDLSTNTVKAKIAVGQNPDGEAITPDGSRVYITNTGSHSVSVINTASNTVISTIPLVDFTTGVGYILTDFDYVPVAGAPTGIAVSPDGKHVYVANSGIAYTINSTDNSGHITGKTDIYIIYVIDTTTGEVGMLSLGRNPTGLCVSSDGTLLYVSDFDSNIISVINVQQSHPVRPIVISGSSDPIVSAGVADVVTNIAEPTDHTTSVNPGMTSPYIMALTPDGSRIYVTNVNYGTVTAINTATNTIAATINVGQGPHGICISPDGSKVYVASVITNSVAVISTATNSVIQTYSSFDSPSVLSLSPDGKLLYINDVSIGDLVVIDPISTGGYHVFNYIDLGGTVGANDGQVSNFITPGNCSGSPVTFTITVNPINTADAVLTTITTTPKTTLTSTTGPGYRNYTASVANAISSIQITPTAEDANATITVNEQAVASGTLSQAISLAVGANTITIAVTAQDGVTVKNYIITITRVAPPVATLASLTISAGALSPAFASSTTNYTMHVSNATASIKLTPTATAGDASITVNGTAVLSGAASASIPLSVGDNIINTVVTASDGTTIKTYTLTVTRSAAGLSNNALLSSLKISPSTTLTTVTGPGYKNYTTAVPNSETSLSVTSVVQDATAIIKVNGTAVASGAASQSIPLAVGANVITVAVTAQDGTTVKNYIITATRASSSIATLANLTTSAGSLNPAFASLTTAYTAHIPNATTSIKLTPTATAGDAAIKVNGTGVVSGSASASIPLSVGDNMINTVVTASNGTTVKTYTLTITRSAAGLSTNAILTSLKISPNTAITTVTGPGYKNYTTTVPNSETSLSVTSVVQDATATIKVNGTAVASGAASPSIPLAVGANVITVAVTAQDGATVKNYILTATRAPSSIATLSSLTTSSGTLSPVFASSTTAYTVQVPNATASIKLTPTATAGDASIKINGTAVLSGAASASVPLNVGDNMINTVITASDGITIKTYTLAVTRSAAGLSTNALLTSLKINPNTTITTVTGPGYKNYTTAVPNSETSLTVTAVVQDATATIKVNGVTVASGVASQSIPLSVGANVINTVVTAQDGATTKNYIITATRTGPVQSLVSLNESPDSLKTTDGVIVHPGISPNGDGISDYLVIDGLGVYPDNKLTIMARSGITVFEAKNYGSKVFDGHSSINGSMQLPGTYFYLLQYNNGKENKRKTGFILLKY